MKLLMQKKWRTYSQYLFIEKKYPGLNGIGVIHKVHESNLDQYLKLRKKKVPNFTIRKRTKYENH